MPSDQLIHGQKDPWYYMYGNQTLGMDTNSMILEDEACDTKLLP